MSYSHKNDINNNTMWLPVDFTSLIWWIFPENDVGDKPVHTWRDYSCQPGSHCVWIPSIQERYSHYLNLLISDLILACRSRTRLSLSLVSTLCHSKHHANNCFSDIQFWKSRKSLEGLSIRSIIFNIFTQLIVVLYVLDNDTNTMVAISVCIGLVIEAWKITKVMDITVRVPCLALLKVFIFPHSHDFHNALYIILIYALGVRIARKISKKWIE